MRLSRRQLNRATLARQLLLQRADVDVVEAVEAVAGLQAQEPASPFLALAARLSHFDPDALARALHDRRLVKATLHRSTLHLVSAADYRASLPALREVTRTKWMQEARGRPVRQGLPELTEAALDYARVPRTNVELRDHAGGLGEPVAADELWRRIRRYGAFVHVPGDEAWAFGRRPRHVAARHWLGDPRIGSDDGDDTGHSLEHLVRAHLRAFGPARLADIARWCGVAVGRLRIGLARIPDVVRYEDDEGRELVDLPGAPLPPTSTPAPPRLLPMWDELLLAFEDRSRVLPESVRRRVIVTAGDVLPTFLVDGMVAGLWWAEAAAEMAPRIVLEPFEPLAPDVREALEAEAATVAALIAGREPAVYARYRHTRRRR